MEMQELHTQLKTDLSKLAQTDKLLLTLAREMYIITSKRIFTDGILSSGDKLRYKSNAVLAGASSFATKAGFNKIAGSKAKRSKLKWLTLPSGAHLFEVEGGFKKIKELSGRPNPFDFTGQLKKSYYFEGRKGEAVIGFLDVKRLTPDGKATSTTNKEVQQGLEAQKDKIFELTASEEKQIDNIINDYLDEVFK